MNLTFTLTRGEREQQSDRRRGFRHRFVEQWRPVKGWWFRRQSPASAMIVADARLDHFASSRFPFHGSDHEDVVPRVQLNIVRVVRRWVRVVAGHEVDTDIPLLAGSYEHERAIIIATEVRVAPSRLRAPE